MNIENEKIEVRWLLKKIDLAIKASGANLGDHYWGGYFRANRDLKDSIERKARKQAKQKDNK